MAVDLLTRRNTTSTSEAWERRWTYGCGIESLRNLDFRVENFWLNSFALSDYHVQKKSTEWDHVDVGSCIKDKMCA